ncbi:hypothetical protein [Oceanobacillus chungangensis]|uniref:hypothetical protein n=1 Tax=Oceanobacillus chungangensis TaxID=1229152 RepID=UPI0011C067F9|nr:hypothetical protein [Oceanobacillus chungangensis]
MESVWNKYEVQSTKIGEYLDRREGNPIISIDVYDKNDIPIVEEYLEDSLSKDDLTKYEIVVFSNMGKTY